MKTLRSFVLSVAIASTLSGCALHRQPKLTAAQILLTKTPAHQSQAPTPKPEDF